MMNMRAVPKEVRPLEPIIYTYGRCCQPDAEIIDMTPSGPSISELKSGELTPEEYSRAKKQYNVAVAIAKLVCGDCPIQPQCRQYTIHAEASGISAGRPISIDNPYKPDTLRASTLISFVERSVERFPTEPDKILPIRHTPMEQILGLDDNPAADNVVSLVQNG